MYEFTLINNIPPGPPDIDTHDIGASGSQGSFFHHPEDMYFPTSAARQLATSAALPNIPTELVIALASNPRKSLFCTLTRTVVALWLARVNLYSLKCLDIIDLETAILPPLDFNTNTHFHSQPWGQYRRLVVAGR